MNSLNHPRCIVFDSSDSAWLLFESAHETIVVDELSDLLPALDRIEEAVRTRGLWAVGWLSYEAAPAFDPKFTVRADEDFPRLLFGLFAEPIRSLQCPWVPGSLSALPWQACTSEAQYREAVLRAQQLIARGDTYQVNYSFRLRAALGAEGPEIAEALFASMVEMQAGGYSAFIDAGRFVVCCASPELLFERHDHRVECNPMKGTARRGRFPSEDVLYYEQLSQSLKDHAENVMIVDMVRNDLSRVAERGSVITAPTCEVERYPRVFQMTRGVSATTACSLRELLSALYPAASITGAPKHRTMEIIAQLETTPRRIYTGSIGFISPHGREVFNVAIRTALIDRQEGTIEYGVGSGIVWDSRWRSEYHECFVKAAAVLTRPESFDLFETLLWEPGAGFFLLDRHIERLFESARFFGWNVDRAAIGAVISELTHRLEVLGCSQRVRIFLAKRGELRSEHCAVVDLPRPYRVCLACHPINSEDRTLFHKTTARAVYDSAEPEVPGVSDVILWNERGEITETRIANIALEIDGVLYTPPVTSGLLPGCYRAELLARGEVQERVLFKDDLLRANKVYLLNSLRRMWSVEVVVAGYEAGVPVHDPSMSHGLRPRS